MRDTRVRARFRPLMQRAHLAHHSSSCQRVPDAKPGLSDPEGALSPLLLPHGTIDLGERETRPRPCGRPGVRRDRRRDIIGAERCWTRPQSNRAPRGLTSDTPPVLLLQEP
jgi:hypothetical protein